MGVGVRRADIRVRPMDIRVQNLPHFMPKMATGVMRMDITPTHRPTLPDYKIPEVVTPRRSEHIPRYGIDSSGVRAASPDRLVTTPRRGSAGVGAPARGDSRGEGRGEGRGDGRGEESRGEGRGNGSDQIRDHDDRIRRPEAGDRLREQRDRNTRGEGRGDGRGDGRTSRYYYPDHHRGYLVSRPSDYFLCDRPTYRYTGSGLSIRGGYLGDRFSVDARLTSGILGLDGFRTGTFYPSSTWLSCNNGWVGGHWNGYYWSTFDVPYGYPSAYWTQYGARTDLTDAVPGSEARVVEGDYAYGETVTGDVRMREMRTPVQMPVAVDESGAMTAQSLSPVSELTPLDNGIMALMDGDAARGADELRVHLREHRDDGRALRLLSVALAENSQPVDAAAVMRMAHEMDPALATETIGLDALGYDDARLRELVDDAVVHAHRVKAQHSTEAASAWLTVGVLMREQGRDDLAREMIKRAQRAGLRSDVVETLELAWR